MPPIAPRDGKHCLALPLGNRPRGVTASIGYTLFPQDDADADTLLRHADQAMYAAKQAGRNRFHEFDASQERQSRKVREQIQRLREALTQASSCCSCSPRWTCTGHRGGRRGPGTLAHPERGVLAPGAFLPLLDGTELEIVFGQWVVEACAGASLQTKAGLHMPVSINVGPAPAAPRLCTLGGAMPGAPPRMCRPHGGDRNHRKRGAVRPGRRGRHPGRAARSGRGGGAFTCCRAAGSSMVVRSPGSRRSATACRARRSSLPLRVLGSTFTKVHARWPGHGAQLVSTCFMTSPSSFRRAASSSRAPRHPWHGKGHGHLALELVGHAHHRHLGNVGVRCNALLDLARAQAVAGHVDHVVGAAQDEVVAVGVADAPVKGAVEQAAGDALPVGVDEALVVAPHGLHAAGGQRAFDGHHALLVGAGQLFAGGLVDQLHA
jgi:hypothetical protein